MLDEWKYLVNIVLLLTVTFHKTTVTVIPYFRTQ